MFDKRSVKVSEAVRDCVRLCLFAHAPSAVLASLMQTMRENGEFSRDEALSIERTVARVLRKALPSEIDGTGPMMRLRPQLPMTRPVNLRSLWSKNDQAAGVRSAT